eukprot:TRINITY_DN5777_c0_g1_i3.p1 TRINITY_DN5777_c0_g1~~TRINITY_DN5777_c0_g1_i3.p1  ORF type:complete len:491 (+),score=70.54 TRINITY_DN5777_c0_g1_i3:283-1755(+)
MADQCVVRREVQCVLARVLEITEATAWAGYVASAHFYVLHGVAERLSPLLLRPPCLRCGGEVPSEGAVGGAVGDDGQGAWYASASLLCLKLAEECDMVRQYAWNELHHGYWKDVHPMWRILYGSAALLSVLCSLLASPCITDQLFRECVRDLDMMLLFSTPRLTPLASGLVSALESHRASSLVEEETSEFAALSFSSPQLQSSSEPIGSKRTLVSDSPLHQSQSSKRQCVRTHGTDEIPHPRAIPRISRPSCRLFHDTYRKPAIPVVITDAISHWRALSDHPWHDIKYLRSVIGHRLLPVEIGRSYLEREWKQELMTGNEYLERYLCRDAKSEPEGVGYVAQTNLFDQISSLRQDIAVPDYCFFAELEGSDSDGEDDVELPTINAWFGPQGTITPCHNDPKDNLLCQVVGHKYVRLYSPQDSRYLYPIEGMLKNNSQVDVMCPDLESFPEFLNAHGFDCKLGPGDMLFIPKGWWHYVESLSVSFSVSFWW